MMGKKSRDRGDRIERAIAKYLTTNGPWGKVITTRNANGGRRFGDDLCRDDEENPLLPVSIEVKGARGAQPDATAWLKQANESAKGRPYVVIWRPGDGPIGRSWVIEPDDEGTGWTMRWLEQWVDFQKGRGGYSLYSPSSSASSAASCSIW